MPISCHRHGLGGKSMVHWQFPMVVQWKYSPQTKTVPPKNHASPKPTSWLWSDPTISLDFIGIDEISQLWPYLSISQDFCGINEPCQLVYSLTYEAYPPHHYQSTIILFIKQNSCKIQVYKKLKYIKLFLHDGTQPKIKQRMYCFSLADTFPHSDILCYSSDSLRIRVFPLVHSSPW